MTRKCPLRKRRLHFYSSKKKTQLNEKHEKRKISICLPIIFMTSNLPFFFFHFFPKNWKTLSPCSFLLFKILNKLKKMASPQPRSCLIILQAIHQLKMTCCGNFKYWPVNTCISNLMSSLVKKLLNKRRRKMLELGLQIIIKIFIF